MDFLNFIIFLKFFRDSHFFAFVYRIRIFSKIYILNFKRFTKVIKWLKYLARLLNISRTKKCYETASASSNQRNDIVSGNQQNAVQSGQNGVAANVTAPSVERNAGVTGTPEVNAPVNR